MSDPAGAGDAPKRRVPRWLWLALVASGALNLLLIGLIAGAAAFRSHWAVPAVAQSGAFAYLRTLPRERREEIRRASGDGIAVMRPLWQATREARREADRLFVADPFDAEKFLAAHQRWLDREAAARRAASRLLAVAGSRMSLEERRAMLSWRERQGRRWRDRGPGETGDEPPGPPPGMGPQRN